MFCKCDSDVRFSTVRRRKVNQKIYTILFQNFILRVNCTHTVILIREIKKQLTTVLKHKKIKNPLIRLANYKPLPWPESARMRPDYNVRRRFWLCRSLAVNALQRRSTTARTARRIASSGGSECDGGSDERSSSSDQTYGQPRLLFLHSLRV